MPIREVRAEVPPALALVVQRCMKKDPAQRFASITDLRHALRLALATKDVGLDDGTVPMTHAPVRPPPVKSDRPPATLPMPPIKTPPPPAPAPGGSAAIVVVPPPAPSGPSLSRPSAPIAPPASVRTAAPASLPTPPTGSSPLPIVAMLALGIILALGIVFVALRVLRG